MLEPVTRSLKVDAAKKLVRLKADANVQARVAKLARKCNEGELTREEAAEYDRYIAYADVVAILHAYGRRNSTMMPPSLKKRWKSLK